VCGSHGAHTHENNLTVNFREDPRILKVVDEIAMMKGTDRSALYREAIRFWLKHEQSRDLNKILNAEITVRARS
jgi:metal-responsive CopG/Arc/MetJ family transcriptional regulator